MRSSATPRDRQEISRPIREKTAGFDGQGRGPPTSRWSPAKPAQDSRKILVADRLPNTAGAVGALSRFHRARCQLALQMPPKTGNPPRSGWGADFVVINSGDVRCDRGADRRVVAVVGIIPQQRPQSWREFTLFGMVTRLFFGKTGHHDRGPRVVFTGCRSPRLDEPGARRRHAKIDPLEPYGVNLDTARGYGDSVVAPACSALFETGVPSGSARPRANGTHRPRAELEDPLVSGSTACSHQLHNPASQGCGGRLDGRSVEPVRDVALIRGGGRR
jgi:hypothetical protein